MKRNALLILAIVVVGTLTLTLNTLRAQNTPAPGSPPVVQQSPSPAPGRPGGMPPGFRGRTGMNYRNAVMLLKRAKTDLENSKDDFDGHRQSAIEACGKAIQELEAVQASVQASAAKAAAAAPQGAQPTQTPAPAPAPAPAQ